MSIYSSDMVVIDDTNYTQWVNPIVNGERRGTGYQAPAVKPRAANNFAALSERYGIPLLPESQWDQRIDELEQSRSTLRNLCDDMGMSVLDQKSTNYCWVFGPSQCARIVRLQETGRIFDYSPASAGARIKNYKNVGGWGREAIEWFRVNGLNFQSDWPPTEINKRYETPENVAKAKLHLVLEYWYLDTFEQMASVILSGFPCSPGYNWWSHQVCGVGIIKGNHDLLIANSWGTGWSDNGYGILSGSKKRPDDAVVITSMLAV